MRTFTIIFCLFLSVNAIGQTADTAVKSTPAKSDSVKIILDGPPPLKTKILYVVDGKEIYTYTLPKKIVSDPGIIESIDVLKPNEAKIKYGKLGENGAVIVKTKNGAIPLYEKKLNTLSQDYEKFMYTHHHDDAEVYYVINGEVLYEQPTELNARVVKLSSREIKSIKFYDKWSSDLGNPHPTLIIITK